MFFKNAKLLKLLSLYKTAHIFLNNVSITIRNCTQLVKKFVLHEDKLICMD